ncbi:hypothetical protein CDCA_CDCA13G3619 [Cyanidium caldarium]|uniref:Uncharacterized protein n=1 Tax=Cyanidium caldarium TaxID=2771 RepID=A0AAV9IZ59_CYACA|nr:hypothetical protein CDCA_CDCA13G3619 [Cyanidium caldarium]
MGRLSAAHNVRASVMNTHELEATYTSLASRGSSAVKQSYHRTLKRVVLPELEQLLEKRAGDTASMAEDRWTASTLLRREDMVRLVSAMAAATGLPSGNEGLAMLRWRLLHESKVHQYARNVLYYLRNQQRVRERCRKSKAAARDRSRKRANIAVERKEGVEEGVVEKCSEERTSSEVSEKNAETEPSSSASREGLAEVAWNEELDFLFSPLLPAAPEEEWLSLGQLTAKGNEEATPWFAPEEYDLGISALDEVSRAHTSLSELLDVPATLSATPMGAGERLGRRTSRLLRVMGDVTPVKHAGQVRSRESSPESCRSRSESLHVAGAKSAELESIPSRSSSFDEAMEAFYDKNEEAPRSPAAPARPLLLHGLHSCGEQERRVNRPSVSLDVGRKHHRPLIHQENTRRVV